jgi:hypothetical protein
MIYFSRVIPPSFCGPQFEEFDRKVRLCFENIVGFSPNGDQWEQCQLSIRFGGLGLRSVYRHSDASYVGSFSSTRGLMSLILNGPRGPSPYYLSSLLSLQADLGEDSEFDPEFLYSQKSLSRRIDKIFYQNLLDKISTRNKARMLSIGNQGAYLWLSVIPSRQLGHRFSHEEYSVLVKWWLGARILDSPSTCPHCRQVFDVYGDHGTTCGSNYSRTRRHDELRDVILGYCSKGALGASPETPRLIPGSLLRPADIFIPNWSMGRGVCLDFSGTSPLLTGNIQGSATTHLYSASRAAEEKMKKYGEICSKHNLDFIPVIFETYGGWSEDSLEVFSRISKAAAPRMGISPSQCNHYILQNLSVTLQRHNAIGMLSRIDYSTATGSLSDVAHFSGAAAPLFISDDAIERVSDSSSAGESDGSDGYWGDEVEEEVEVSASGDAGRDRDGEKRGVASRVVAADYFGD